MAGTYEPPDKTAEKSIKEGDDCFWGNIDKVEEREDKDGDIDPYIYAGRVMTGAAFYLKGQGFSTEALVDAVNVACEDAASRMEKEKKDGCCGKHEGCESK